MFYRNIMKLEGDISSETLVTAYQITQRHIREDSNAHYLYFQWKYRED